MVITPEARLDAAIRARVFRVREPVTPSQWAMANLSLPPGLNAIPGPFVPFPFQIEPLDAITEKGLSSLTLCWASQVLGKSQLLSILIGWTIAENPCGIVLLLPTLDVASQWSRTKLGPMLADTEALRGLVIPATGRKQADGSGGNQILLKLFPQGFLAIVGSNSAAGLASHTARVVVADELDRLDAGGSEGDPLAIASRRSETFQDSFRIQVSSPTLKDSSRILDELALSDARKWHVRCPACEKPFVLEWDMIRWEKDSAGGHLPKTARVQCPHCEERLSDLDRVKMVKVGQWVPTNPSAEPHARGYQANAFITLLPSHQSYENRLHQWASEWLAAQKKGVSVIKTFVNTVICQGWKVELETSSQPEVIYARREAYPCDEADPKDCLLNEQIRLIVTGVDVQTDRLELEVVGWSANLESWSLDYRVLRGNLAQNTIWTELAQYLQSKFPHPYGFECPIDAVGIDTGGHYTKQVYQFAAARPLANTFALKGKGTVGQAWLEKSERVRWLYLVSVDIVKRTIYDQLNIQLPGPGFCHIPAGRDYLWIEQLTAEQCVNRRVNGVLIPRFELPSGKRNEGLDCRVYARTCVEILRPNWRAIEEKFQNRKAAAAVQDTRRGPERLKPEPVIQQSGPQKQDQPRVVRQQRPRYTWGR